MYVYVRNKSKSSKRGRENSFLVHAIECIAKKYNVVKKQSKRQNKQTPIALYDFKNNKPFRKKQLDLLRNRRPGS